MNYTPPRMAPSLLLSIDFEDWVQLIARDLSNPDWDRANRHLERQMDTVFDLLDAIGARATFFLLGVSAKNYPNIVDEIDRRGFEIGSHGYNHLPVDRLTRRAFRDDLERSIEVIEQITGSVPLGYRAPRFSLTHRTPWALEMLADVGFRYDSSQYVSLKDARNIDRIPVSPYLLRLDSGRTIWEVPQATYPISRWSFPVGGGGYWRLLPRCVVFTAVKRLIADGQRPSLYFHPYDFDPERLEPPSSGGWRSYLRGKWLAFRFNVARRRVDAHVRELGETIPMGRIIDALQEISGEDW